MLNDFRQFQFALARHLRDPLVAARPEGVSSVDAQASLQHMFETLSALLSPTFPVSRALLGETLWRHAVQLFLQDAPPHAPWTGAVQRAFARYLRSSPHAKDLPAWLQDMAHFEWLKSAVQAAMTEVPAFDARGDLMSCALVLNPTHVEVAYEWPVHTIDAQHKPDDMQRTHLSVLLDRKGKLRVLESSVFRAQLLALLAENGVTGQQAFESLARWLDHPEPAEFVAQGVQVLEQLQREGVVLGVVA